MQDFVAMLLIYLALITVEGGLILVGYIIWRIIRSTWRVLTLRRYHEGYSKGYKKGYNEGAGFGQYKEREAVEEEEKRG